MGEFGVYVKLPLRDYIKRYSFVFRHAVRIVEDMDGSRWKEVANEF